MVGIVDISLGNVKSVTNWLDRCNVQWTLIHKPDDSKEFDLIILPGVGSALEFMTKLETLNFTSYLKKKSKEGQRIMGICLGAQVLFDFSEEDGGVECLGILKGRIEQIPLKSSNTGWLPCAFDKRFMSELWQGKRLNLSRKQVVEGRVFFNHRYGIKLKDSANIDSKIRLKELSCYSALVHKKNIVACQFHPEKSQVMGELLLKMILS